MNNDCFEERNAVKDIEFHETGRKNMARNRHYRHGNADAVASVIGPGGALRKVASPEDAIHILAAPYSLV